MRIGLIITAFESEFASSFTHTARVKFGVEFESSNVESILKNLKILKIKINSGMETDVKVGWQMYLDHVIKFERLLNDILNKYEEIFYVRPLDKKVFTINAKLRETEQQNPKDIAMEVLQAVFTPPEKKKISREEQIKLKVHNKCISRGIKILNKSKAESQYK